MQGMILAAGFGTRLKPHTDSMPKALVPIMGRPMIALVIEKFILSGITEIAVNAHYYAEMVEEYIKKAEFGADIKVVPEEKILGTGGGIFNMLPHISEEDFIVQNCDVVCDVDLADMMNYHKNRGAAATMLMQDRDTYNQVIIDTEDNFCGLNLVKKGIRKIAKEPAGQSYLFAFCGIHAVNKKEIGKFRQIDAEYSIIDVYLKAVSSNRRIISYKPGINWFDIGTIEKLKEAEEYLRSNPFPVLKICGSCGSEFRCEMKVDCSCNSIRLSSEAEKFIKKSYTDCLCPLCLKNISEKFNRK